MKRVLLLMVMVVMALSSTMAQSDDMYFVPKKEVATTTQKQQTVAEKPTYYRGRDCDVDEYNRRGKLKSYYQKIGSDTLGNDIIEFHAGDGTYELDSSVDTAYVYPGSEQYYDEDDYDYAYSRRLGRFYDFYGWYDPFFYGYWGYPYWRSYYGWYSPWYYGYYDPWYYSGWYGWGYPYYYGWSAWQPVRYYHNYGPTGTMNHSRGTFAGVGRSSHDGSYSAQNGTSGSFGKRRNAYNGNTSSNRTNTNTNTYNFGGRRNTTNSSTYSRPITSSPSRSTFGGGSFGGSRGGSFGGGGRVGGGGGGGSFGGRR